MLPTAAILMAAGLMTAPPAPALAEAANAFLEALSDTQRDQAVFDFDAEERWNWHFVPRARAGVSFGDLEAAQHPLAFDLLKAGLSEYGFETVETIRDLEHVLREIEGPRATHRNPDDFYFTIFGTPSANGAWALRYEGHHISLHWTIVGGKAIASTPQFLGANPAEVKSGPRKGARALGVLEDLGRAFVTALPASQKDTAIIAGTAPRDILTRADREAEMQADEGIAYGALSDEQQEALVGLIEAHARYQHPAIAAQRLARIKRAGLDEVKFAWMGGLETGQGHYYRIQGKTFIIEYDNIQNNANHIHTVWRDFHGDFGRDLLQEHYARHPH